MGIVILNAMIAAVTENAANSALAALASLSQAEATVIRDGKEQKIPSTHVVRGDIVLLETGDIVPADGRVFESAELKVNEMLLTGEPDDVAKTHKVKVSQERKEDRQKLKESTSLADGVKAQRAAKQEAASLT